MEKLKKNELSESKSIENILAYIKDNLYNSYDYELQLENKEKFYESIRHLKIFLDEIKHRKDYISIYDPFIHKIVITL
jgi:hypothetical protein